MNSNSHPLINQFGFLYHNFLFSWLSRAAHWRGNTLDHSSAPYEPLVYEEGSTLAYESYYSDKTHISSWDYINQVISTVIVWIILGFAAGFLMGML
jgi:hypothetical protein